MIESCGSVCPRGGAIGTGLYSYPWPGVDGTGHMAGEAGFAFQLLGAASDEFLKLVVRADAALRGRASARAHHLPRLRAPPRRPPIPMDAVDLHRKRPRPIARSLPAPQAACMSRPSDPSPPLSHDTAYKAMYGHRQAILDLRRYLVAPNGPLGPETLAALDFSTLTKLPAEWVTADFRRRHGDQVWRIRFKDAAPDAGAGAWLLLLLEFQSRDDPDMALRILGYVVELYRDLEAQGVVRPGNRRPPVPLATAGGAQRGVAVARAGGGGGADCVAGGAGPGAAGPRDVAALSAAARG